MPCFRKDKNQLNNIDFMLQEYIVIHVIKIWALQNFKELLNKILWKHIK